jgi:hypothetical protein
MLLLQFHPQNTGGDAVDDAAKSLFSTIASLQLHFMESKWMNEFQQIVTEVSKLTSISGTISCSVCSLEGMPFWNHRSKKTRGLLPSANESNRVNDDDNDDDNQLVSVVDLASTQSATFITSCFLCQRPIATRTTNENPIRCPNCPCVMHDICFDIHVETIPTLDASQGENAHGW